MAEFNKTILQPDRIHQQADTLAAILRAPIQEESPARLAEFQKAARGEPMTVAMGPGLGDTPVVPLKPFVKARAQSVADQLEGKLEGKTINSGFGR